MFSNFPPLWWNPLYVTIVLIQMFSRKKSFLVRPALRHNCSDRTFPPVCRNLVPKSDVILPVPVSKKNQLFRYRYRVNSLKNVLRRFLQNTFLRLFFSERFFGSKKDLPAPQMWKRISQIPTYRYRYSSGIRNFSPPKSPGPAPGVKNRS